MSSSEFNAPGTGANQLKIDKGAYPKICSNPECDKVWQYCVDQPFKSFTYLNDFPKYKLRKILCPNCSGEAAKMDFVSGA
jgi:hypothetical protein